MSSDTFIFEDSFLVIDGRVIDGFGDGDDVVNFEFEDDDWTIRKGADGHVMRAKVGNTSVKVTAKLLFSARSNQILSDLRESGRKFSLFWRDSRGGSEVKSEDAFVMRKPDFGVGKEPADIEWEIMCMSSESKMLGIDDQNLLV